MDRVIHAGVNATSLFNAPVAANGMQDPFGTNGAALPSTTCFRTVRGRRIEIQSEAIVRMQSPYQEANL